jgi:hypothetical protein
MTTHLKHPDHHMAASAWSEDQTLHVAACYSNPYRWRTRRELANDFRRHIAQSPNVKLHVIELAYGDRPHEVSGPDDLQLRTKSELFHKENLLNLAIQRFDPGWKYGAYVDMDFHFTRHDWALEAVHQLQHHAWVQLFSSYADLSDTHRLINQANGFVWNYIQNGYKVAKGAWGYGGRGFGATGGAWAFRRDAFDAVGGLLDRCILGHADWFMAFGLAGVNAPDMRIAGYSPGYRHYIDSWVKRAAVLEKNIGYVEGFVTHGFHGPKGKRGYSSRDKILVETQFDPLVDVAPDWQGALQLLPGRPKLRDQIRSYFLSRSEDVPHQA